MATWNGVITNAGNSLLNEWVNEKTLNFDSAAAGQGTVAAAAMMAQTALVNEKQTASLLGGERVSSGIRLKLRIAAPNTAYTLNQFRVSQGSTTMTALRARNTSATARTAAASISGSCPAPATRPI